MRVCGQAGLRLVAAGNIQFMAPSRRTLYCKVLYNPLAFAYYGSMSEREPEMNSLCEKAILFLSCLALLSVLSGYTQPPQTDEGTGAHIFQLSIVLLAPTIFLFLVTADWSRPLRAVRPLALSTVALFLAFGALYYLEHYRDPNYEPHGRAAPAARPESHNPPPLLAGHYRAHLGLLVDNQLARNVDHDFVKRTGELERILEARADRESQPAPND